MNSTSIENLLPLISSPSQPDHYSPILITAIILLLGVCAAVITFLVKSAKSFAKFRRLLFHFSTKADTSTTMISSPDDKGRFPRPIWCKICNEYVDHVNNLCPHVGQKFYFSVLHRRMFEYWRRQLQQHYQVSIPDATKAKVSSDCTIDLNDLVACDHGLERKVSRVSIIFSSPKDTSTPNGDRFQRAPIRRTETNLGRIRKILRSLSARRLSNESSGIGVSIISADSMVQELKL